jgi:prepilin-type N-terminal cleavage/methylation domain-containing protein
MKRGLPYAFDAARRGFTLIELLVIVAIICAMMGVGVMSIRGGQAAARVKGATRDVFAAIRQARSQALVSQQPVIITYSTVDVDGEVAVKVETTGAKLFSSGVDRSKIRTVTGEPLKEARVTASEAAAARAAARAKSQAARAKLRSGGSAAKAAEGAAADASAASGAKEEGSIVEDVLFAPIHADVVKGMRIKVVKGEDEAAAAAAEGRKPRVSVFSNVDYLLEKFNRKQTADAAKTAAGDAASGAASSKTSAKKDSKLAKAGDDQEPVSVVWETNGRVDPHQVWVYADGQRPEDGLSIRIDRFGAAKVLSGDGREDD